ncbi:tyrosine-type recombinase/integrase [Rhodovulum sp. DZ06]|uniref:tyrosine-type recombinase/integrase n=1 Tax=Rhodovulum sp. DZ06 TaxID=3425126 RepID=UPI003D333F44
MPTKRLSKSVVEKIQPGPRDVVIWDEALPGFGLRVKPSGVRSYVVQYRAKDTGATRRATIGRHGPLLSFDQAKKQARALLADAMRGADPVAEKTEARKAPTMRDLCDDYLTRHAIPNKRPNSVRNDRGLIDGHVLPALGRKRVRDVARRDVEDLRERMAATPYQANRALALLSKMFSLAVAWGWRPDNPARGVARFQEEKRRRWLSDAELRRLWQALERRSGQPAAEAVKLQLLTGARLGEVLGAKVGDFDLDRGVWTKPSHQTKQKRTEHLPLSAPAVELVGALCAGRAPGDWLFPGRVEGQPLREIKRFWAALTAEAGLEDYRRHDNRHTFASHLVSSGLSLEIVGQLLGHSSAETTKRYAHLADDALRNAADRFGGKVAGAGGLSRPDEKE